MNYKEKLKTHDFELIGNGSESSKLDYTKIFLSFIFCCKKCGFYFKTEDKSGSDLIYSKGSWDYYNLIIDKNSILTCDEQLIKNIIK